MFFEGFMWGEERLGLLSGVSFVLIGVFAYLLYLQELSLVSILLMVLGMLATSGTAIFFQMPRIRGTRAAISTFLGGLSIGLAIILWVIACAAAGEDILHEVLVFTLAGVELFLAFFGVGFLLLALYPSEAEPVSISKSEKSERTKKSRQSETHEHNQDDDIFERL